MCRCRLSFLHNVTNFRKQNKHSSIRNKGTSMTNHKITLKFFTLKTNDFRIERERKEGRKNDRETGKNIKKFLMKEVERVTDRRLCPL